MRLSIIVFSFARTLKWENQSNKYNLLKDSFRKNSFSSFRVCTNYDLNKINIQEISKSFQHNYA